MELSSFSLMHLYCIDINSLFSLYCIKDMLSFIVIVVSQCWCISYVKSRLVLNQFSCVQNGTTEEVKKIVATLNEGQVPSHDVVGKSSSRVCTFVPYCSL